jgi:hypothetical protein
MEGVEWFLLHREALDESCNEFSGLIRSGEFTDQMSD